MWFVIYYIHKTDLHTYPASKKENGNVRGKYYNILYFLYQGIYNLNSIYKLNSLCFGKFSKFPVLSLTGIFLAISLFSLCSGDPDRYKGLGGLIRTYLT